MCAAGTRRVSRSITAAWGSVTSPTVLATGCPLLLPGTALIGSECCASPKSQGVRKSQPVSLGRVRRDNGTLQSSTRCSSDALSLSRSLPVAAGADTETWSCSLAGAAGYGGRITQARRSARDMRCMERPPTRRSTLAYASRSHTPVLALRRCGTPITDEVGSTLTRQRAGACAFRRSRPGIGGAPTPVTDDAVSAGVLLEADILFPGWPSGLAVCSRAAIPISAAC
jgi:hypothetical protein